MVIRATFLADVETPISLYYKISQGETMGFLLESNEDDTRLARYSFMGINPSKTILFREGQAIIQDNLQGTEEQFEIHNPLTFLQQMIEEENRNNPLIQEAPPDFPFTGGLVGYMGYGATRYFEGIPRQENDPLCVPDGYYGLYDSVILFDHLYRRIFFISYREEQAAQALWQSIEEKLHRAAPLTPLPYSIHDVPEEEIFDGVTGPFTEQSFCDAVRQAKEYIMEGQAFQIVLAQRFSLPLTAPPINVYRMVRAINPSPYSYFLQFPEFSYLGSSPETFARCHEGHLEVKVLAGTRPRGLSEEADKQLEAELLVDEKELAEHRMLVDLGRNDLGRVCKTGSIQVGDIATLTRYTHVMHLSTKVTGHLREDKICYDAFQSCFPRGTVSGAPKIRAMQLLAHLEPEQRGIYSGAVGYFDFAGNMDSAIAIRSVLIKDNQAHVNAGAGVVYDSVPQMEYQETRNKAKSILKSIKLAERLVRDDRAVNR